MSKTEQLRKNLKGVVIAMITPMNDDFSVDLEGMADNVRRAIDAGIVNGRGGLIIGGGGGELAHLSIDERVEILKAAVEAAAGRAPVLGGVQDNGTALSIDVAKRFEDAGADGIQLGQPSFYHTHSDEDFLRYFEAVDKAIEIGIALYNTWWRAPNVSSELLERIAELPNAVACKWSSPNFADYRRGYLKCADKINMIDNGGDILGMHLFGACGFISATGDFWPEYDLETWAAIEAGDYKRAAERMRKLNFPYNEFRGKISKRTGGESPVKKPAAWLCGRAAGPSRPPCRDLTDEELRELVALFKEAGAPMAREP